MRGNAPSALLRVVRPAVRLVCYALLDVPGLERRGPIASSGARCVTYGDRSTRGGFQAMISQDRVLLLTILILNLCVAACGFPPRVQERTGPRKPEPREEDETEPS